MRHIARISCSMYAYFLPQAGGKTGEEEEVMGKGRGGVRPVIGAIRDSPSLFLPSLLPSFLPFSALTFSLPPAKELGKKWAFRNT